MQLGEESLKLTGVVRSIPGGGFGFSDLVATGAHGTARLNGEFGRDKVDLNAIVDVPQAQVLDPRIAGKAEIVTALTGAPDDLNATLKATLSEGRLLDRKTSGVTLEANAVHLTGLVEAKASLSGDVDGRPLQGSAHVAKRADGGWVADNLGLSLASARLAGDLMIGADRLANGELTFSATNLEDLSPLVLTKMSGGLQAKLSASSAEGRQSVSIAANSDKMSVGGNRLESLNVDLTIGDVWSAKNVSGLARLSRADATKLATDNPILDRVAGGDSARGKFTACWRSQPAI